MFCVIQGNTYVCMETLEILIARCVHTCSTQSAQSGALSMTGGE